MYSGDCHRRADTRLRARMQMESAAMRSMAEAACASTMCGEHTNLRKIESESGTHTHNTTRMTNETGGSQYSDESYML